MTTITIAIDAMGGDHGIQIPVPAAVEAVRQHKNLQLILVGDQDAIQKQLQKLIISEEMRQRLPIVHATQIVSMDESPTQALRYKKDSSMRVAINLVKESKAQACVSAGNTGALMATAHFVLKTLSGIDRPAIIGTLPSENELGRVRMLDLGANVDSSAEHLFQFAIMGSMLTTAIDGVPKPKVALLNIGVEEIKGNDQVKQTAQLLSHCPDINYIGYQEGDSIFKSEADVIVCDGFVGNVALKSIEGLTKFVRRNIKKAFYQNILTKLAAIGAIVVLKPFLKRMNPELFNGASLLGLKGIVLKSHGNTSVVGFEKAIEKAMLEVEHNIPQLIEDKIKKLFESRTT